MTHKSWEMEESITIRIFSKQVEAKFINFAVPVGKTRERYSAQARRWTSNTWRWVVYVDSSDVFYGR